MYTGKAQMYTLRSISPADNLIITHVFYLYI